MTGAEATFCTLAILAAPAAALTGVGAGACIAYRLMRGQSPLPPLRKPKVTVEAPKPIETKPFPQPRVRA